MTWRALLFSFEARRFHPNRAETDPTALMCMCRHMCLFKYTHYEGDIFYFFHSSLHIYIQAVSRVSREDWACVGFTGNQDSSHSGGGAYERLLRQRERLVSSNSQEARAQDKNCWLMKEIIYSEAMGKLKSSAPFRGMTSKMRHLKSQNRRS